MKTVTVSISEAETTLSALLHNVEQWGYHVRICRNGEPVAELAPIQKQKNRLVQNPELSGIKFNEDPMAPLPVDFSL
jgi:antitoxin (DNA-binding transcriptional repressor) of toxin-antitoxin stability system